MKLKPQYLIDILDANTRLNHQSELRRADVQLLKRAVSLNLKIYLLSSDWRKVAFDCVNQLDSTIDFVTRDDKWMITKEAGKWHLVVMSGHKWREISTNASPKLLMEKLEFILNPSTHP